MYPGLSGIQLQTCGVFCSYKFLKVFMRKLLIWSKSMQMGSGKVFWLFLDSGIWLKYSAGFRKTQNFLMVNGTSTGEERFIRIFIPGMGCIIREKTIFGIEMAEIHDAGLSLKKERQCRIRKPFQIRYKYNNSNNSLNNDLTHLQIG